MVAAPPPGLPATARPPRREPAPERLAIGLDVGGTKIAGGVVAAGGRVLERTQTPTPSSDDQGATLAAIERLVAGLRARHPRVEAVGVGAAGLVEWPAGRIRFAPHNAYRDLPLRELLEKATGLPVVVDNDANAAAWAEAHHGAGGGEDDIVVVAVGTGIGGGLVLGGRLHRGSRGLGGEVGHMVVAPQGRPCACGAVGCLEAMASGLALGQAGRVAAGADPEGRLAALAGGAGQVTGETVFAAAREGDPTALALFGDAGYWLGVGIATLVTLVDPAVVVVGGGLAVTGELLLAPARASFERFVFARAHRELPPVVPASLGPEAGVVGAALLALAGGG